MKDTFYFIICYGKDGLKGHFKGKSMTEIRQKITEYNSLIDDKIVIIKNPLTKKRYVIQ